MQINLRSVLNEAVPGFLDKYPPLVQKIMLAALSRLVKVDDINNFFREHEQLRGLDVIRAFFNQINFTYRFSEADKKRIPETGRVFIVSNHPLGGLDGLALLLAVAEVRPDVKIVVNELLMYLEPLNDYYLPFNVYATKMQIKQLNGIRESINNEEAIIFFPAGEVSRPHLNGVHDRKWKKGAVQLARKYQVPVLPMYVRGRNSSLFYFTALFSSMASMLLLPREIFKRNQRITIRTGNMIPIKTFKANISDAAATRLLRRHTYRVGRGKKGLFITPEMVIPPVSTEQLTAELAKSRLLCTTRDGKLVYLVLAPQCPQVMLEIGRLRELTFRAVGEGTGKSRDNDIYDNYYKHIVVWDNNEKELVGSYRIGHCQEIFDQLQANDRMYVDTMYTLEPAFRDMQKQALEMGRSFIQAKYWRSNALDVLWQGIGAYLQTNRGIRYMYGTVSISDNYPKNVKNLIVAYYTKWYGGDFSLAKPNKRFILTQGEQEKALAILNGDSHLTDFRNLKETMRNMGYTLPILYKRYTELCEYGGVKFVQWSVDETFGNAVDGLVVVDLQHLREDMRKRYYGE